MSLSKSQLYQIRKAKVRKTKVIVAAINREVGQPAKLELSTSYTLQQGKMALWIVSPKGEFLYQNDASDSFNDTISLSLDKGLHSVILVNELDNGQMEGEKFIQGRCAAK